jgi:hypothetical protein
MKRVLVILLVIWGATLAFPTVRERSQPRLSQAWSWMGGRMERPLSPVTNWHRKIQAESQLNEASRLMVSLRNQGRALPETHELTEFLTRHAIAPEGRDPWGMPYRLVPEVDSLAIVSAGKDRVFGTEHDLAARVGLPRRPRAPRGPPR